MVSLSCLTLADSLVRLVPELKLCLHNLFVCFKGYVSEDHVVEKDPQTPYGRLVAIILAELNPLRWGINPGACNENICKMDLNEGGSCEYKNSFSIYIQ